VFGNNVRWRVWIEKVIFGFIYVFTHRALVFKTLELEFTVITGYGFIGFKL
jgi:hypothetical protein